MTSIGPLSCGIRELTAEFTDLSQEIYQSSKQELWFSVKLWVMA